MRTVPTESGTRVSGLGPVTKTKSDRSHVNGKKEIYGGRYELIYTLIVDTVLGTAFPYLRLGNTFLNVLSLTLAAFLQRVSNAYN